jgi:tetratricopeptide (TPR) repeat protein
MARALILLATIVAGVHALRVLVWEPFTCNIDKRYYDGQTVLAAELAERSYGGSYRSLAKANVSGLRRLDKHCPGDLHVLMLLARNNELLEQPGEAIIYYQKALRVSRRPEIYQLLGEAQAAVGRRSEAIANLLMAERADPHYRNTAVEREILELQLRQSSSP